MALTSEATTLWRGDLMSGSGTVRLDSSETGEFAVNWKARTEGDGASTNPEELIAAAHASCFSMAFSNTLAQAGSPPEEMQVTAAVTFDTSNGATITGSHLLVSAKVPGISEDDFQKYANEAKENCPVSRALAGIDITMEASLA